MAVARRWLSCIVKDDVDDVVIVVVVGVMRLC